MILIWVRGGMDIARIVIMVSTAFAIAMTAEFVGAATMGEAQGTPKENCTK